LGSDDEEPAMKSYFVALAVGVLVGTIYGVLDVRSPAPPVVALVGLLGILLGEQVVPIAKRLLNNQPITIRWVQTDCVPHVFGELPKKPGLNAKIEQKVPT
jgi:XapX domain-containing protein